MGPVVLKSKYAISARKFDSAPSYTKQGEIIAICSRAKNMQERLNVSRCNRLTDSKSQTLLSYPISFRSKLDILPYVHARLQSGESLPRSKRIPIPTAKASPLLHNQPLQRHPLRQHILHDRRTPCAPPPPRPLPPTGTHQASTPNPTPILRGA